MNKIFKNHSDEQLERFKETLLYMIGLVEVELSERNEI
jgi:hypothetical protein